LQKLTSIVRFRLQHKFKTLYQSNSQNNNSYQISFNTSINSNLSGFSDFLANFYYRWWFDFRQALRTSIFRSAWHNVNEIHIRIL